jgi:hypothetical protein
MPRSRNMAGWAAATALAFALAGCGGDVPASVVRSPSVPPSTAPTPSAIAPSVTPTARPVPTTWIAPPASTVVRADTVRLSARPGTGMQPSKLAFWAASGGRHSTVCSSSQADQNGVWSCTANLRKSRMYSGAVTLGFNVIRSDKAIDRDPAGTMPITWAVAPSAPTGVDYRATVHADGSISIRVVWNAGSVADANEVAIYGLTTCLAPAKSTDVPCIVRGTPLPSGTLLRFGHANPSAGTIHWTERHDDIFPALGLHGSDDVYFALLVVAVNEFGKSRFVIAATTNSCYDCVID